MHLLVGANIAAVCRVGSALYSVGVYYREEKKALAWRDECCKKNSREKHQKKKKESRYMFDHPLVDGGQPNYEPGFAFEDIPIDGIFDFEERQAGIDRDAQNKELNDAI